jgi:formamidopyrimidine-DNA glycosylase
MPELPEVETTRRGITPYLVGRRVAEVAVREPRLRWPVPAELGERLPGRTIEGVARRGKYLLLAAGDASVLLHLGMSGNLRILPAATPPGRHDHLDIVLEDGRCLRLQDPRRFGAALWLPAPPLAHPLLAHLGPEPLDDAFDGDHLFALSRGRRVAIKPFVMDSKVVVGVGNIYANESLFRARIHPLRAAGRVSRERCAHLAEAIKSVLTEAIAQGGTTLRDFLDGEGRPGYFKQSLQVYDRAGQPCPTCASPIRETRIGQRSTFYCPRCQR